MTRQKTPEQRERWAAYMRSYRATHSTNPNPSLKATDRQIAILKMYADPNTGGNQATVAKTLGISTSAVHNQIGSLLKRLGVRSPAQAVLKLMAEDRWEEK